MKRTNTGSGVALLALLAPASFAAGLPTNDLEEVVVTARLIGRVESSTQGTVTRTQLETRPVLRTGELLETVPGLVVTQHSGDGKANQYFLRGFNLDHGTDLATSADGIPVNMHTHGHGQGYTDINFVIPELLDRIEYKKGTYYADEGNFSAAGAVDLIYRRKFDDSLLSLTVGQDSYARALFAGSDNLGPGDLLWGLEYARTDGPWDLPENLRHVNAVAGWREAHRFFDARERAALNWAEAVNAVPHRVPSDADLEEARRHFSDAEIAELTFAVGAIRSWNMLNASFQMPVPETPYVAAHG